MSEHELIQRMRKNPCSSYLIPLAEKAGLPAEEWNRLIRVAFAGGEVGR